MEWTFQGAKVPPMELSLPGAKVSGNESSIIRPYHPSIWNCLSASSSCCKLTPACCSQGRQSIGDHGVLTPPVFGLVKLWCLPVIGHPQNLFSVSEHICLYILVSWISEVIKIVDTSCQIWRLKYTKFDFGWGSAPDPTGGGYSAPPDP